MLVLCFDRKAWQRDPERYWRLAAEEVRGFLVPATAEYYRDKPAVERDEGMRSCGLVAQNLMLMAQQLGYDSCPMDGFDYQQLGDIIGLPDDHEIAFMLTIGKGIKQPWPRPGRLALSEVLVEDRFC